MLKRIDYEGGERGKLVNGILCQLEGLSYTNGNANPNIHILF